MTDKEIIQGLIERNNDITEQFFYVKCRPLLTAVMHFVFNYPVEYNEMVSELYDYLMADNCAKLKQFQYRSSVYQWLKVVATRFFIRHRQSIIEPVSKEPEDGKIVDDVMIDTTKHVAQQIDVSALLDLMENQRYADVLRHLILHDEDSEKYAESIGVTVDNLYNIKRRAIASLSRIATKYYYYGR